MKKNILITIPVYNEERELLSNIALLKAFCIEHLGNYHWHITIADNASTDETPVIAESLAKKDSFISLLRLEKKGRGRAVKKAWSESKADYCVYMDIDLSTDLHHLPALIHALENKYDIAVGSRLLRTSKVKGRTMIREITSRSLNMLIRILFGTKFTDAQCGFKSVNKKVVEQLLPKIKDNDWFFDGELLIVGEKSGYKIYEEPVLWVDNPGSTVKLFSTIFGDISAIIRILVTQPWKTIHKS